MCIAVLQAWANDACECVKQVIQFIIKVSCLAPLRAKVVGFKQAKHLQSL